MSRKIIAEDENENGNENGRGNQSLTAEERETVISWADDDKDKKIWIYSSQKPMIRTLLKNKYFELKEKHICHAYADPLIAIEGYLPRKMLTIRSKKKTMTPEQLDALRSRMKKLHKKP